MFLLSITVLLGMAQNLKSFFKLLVIIKTMLTNIQLNCFNYMCCKMELPVMVY
jgi:hypothetical protein